MNLNTEMYTTIESASQSMHGKRAGRPKKRCRPRFSDCWVDGHTIQVCHFSERSDSVSLTTVRYFDVTDNNNRKKVEIAFSTMVVLQAILVPNE